MVLVTGAVRSIQKYKFTHFLRVPLATSRSRPQLRESLDLAAQDPITAALPRRTWSVPDEMHYVLGALGLQSPAAVEKAVQILKNMDLHRMIETLVACTRDSTISFDTAKPFSSNDRARHPLERPMVTLRGLYPAPTSEYPSRTKSLTCNITERMPFLSKFRQEVLKPFSKARLMPAVAEEKLLIATLMTTSSLHADVVKSGLRHMGKGYRRNPYFDASDFHEKYNDFPWTTEFPLEKLCISEIGLKDFWREDNVVGTGFRELASIPFPGTAPEVISTQEPDIEYTRAAKQANDYSRETPLVFPSNSPM